MWPRRPRSAALEPHRGATRDAGPLWVWPFQVVIYLTLKQWPKDDVKATLQVRWRGGAPSSTWGCSLLRLELQPSAPRVAASDAWGYSLRHMGLQVYFTLVSLAVVVMMVRRN